MPKLQSLYGATEQHCLLPWQRKLHLTNRLGAGHGMLLRTCDGEDAHSDMKVLRGGRAEDDESATQATWAQTLSGTESESKG